MRIETMEDLFVKQIQDLYDAEERLVEAIPKMAEASSSSELRTAFEDHLRQTAGHVERLEQIFDEIGKEAGGETCKAMMGLIEEGEDIIEAIEQSPLRDAALIAAANRVEYYEMAGYGTARTMAQTLGLTRSAALLEETLEEEKMADEKLTQIAKERVNPQALQMSSGGKTRTAR
jgi:ferritin-like metal-binding protein YciE